MRLLAELKDLKPNLNPASIMTDFELAAINGFATEFPQTLSAIAFSIFLNASGAESKLLVSKSDMRTTLISGFS